MNEPLVLAEQHENEKWWILSLPIESHGFSKMLFCLCNNTCFILWSISTKCWFDDHLRVIPKKNYNAQFRL